MCFILNKWVNCSFLYLTTHMVWQSLGIGKVRVVGEIVVLEFKLHSHKLKQTQVLAQTMVISMCSAGGRL